MCFLIKNGIYLSEFSISVRWHSDIWYISCRNKVFFSCSTFLLGSHHWKPAQIRQLIRPNIKFALQETTHVRQKSRNFTFAALWVDLLWTVTDVVFLSQQLELKLALKEKKKNNKNSPLYSSAAVAAQLMMENTVTCVGLMVTGTSAASPLWLGRTVMSGVDA